jgi:hypothetical protein
MNRRTKDGKIIPMSFRKKDNVAYLILDYLAKECLSAEDIVNMFIYGKFPKTYWHKTHWIMGVYCSHKESGVYHSKIGPPKTPEKRKRTVNHIWNYSNTIVKDVFGNYQFSAVGLNSTMKSILKLYNPRSKSFGLKISDIEF